MKCEKSGSHTISYQSLLLSTIVLNDIIILNDKLSYHRKFILTYISLIESGYG